ncbi:MAG: porin family protein [Bacteroidota bacterium]
MKRLILFLLLLAPVMAMSQVKFGVKGGITSSSIKVNETIDAAEAEDFESLKVQGENAKIGFQGGVFSRITILNLYVQPELLFTSTSGEVEVTEFISDENKISHIREQEFKKLDIPIMVGYKFGPARVQAGPVASIIIDSKSALSEYDNYGEEFNGATWGYQVGVGLDILNKVTLDVKYEGNLSKLGDGVKVFGQERSFDSRTSQFVFNVGIFF